MGSYVFTWEHPADEVYVTGTFDDWSKSEKLTKRDEGHFDKTVHFKSDHDRILYKFVVDGQWTVNHTLPQLEDGTGNVNNVLYPHEITPAASSAIMSNVASGSTTAALAGQVPKETNTRDTPGAFPETPAFDTPSATEHPGFSVAPIPASTGMGNPMSLKAGESVPAHKNTVESAVKLDKASYDQPDRVAAEAFASKSEPAAFSVAPIPASSGMGNPISLKAGESVPHHSTLTSDTIGSNVKLDKESYEHPDRGVASSFGQPPAATSADNSFSVPPVTQGVMMIPESSLPMGTTAGLADPGVDMFTRSAGANTTTAALAGQVPLEPRGKATIIDDDAETVPSIVTQSQKSAHVDPEASANPTAVEEKKDLESELKSKVPEAPAASDSSSIIPSANQVSTAAVAGMAAAGAAVTGAALTAKSYLPASIQKSIDDMNKRTSTSHADSPVAGVPAPVKESIAEAHTSPEAAANSSAVADKTAMERELMSEVKPAAASTSAATSAPSVTSSSTPAASVPVPVKESLHEAHASPEAAASSSAVAEKSTMERELQSKLARDDSVGESAPVIAPSAAAHTSTLVSDPTRSRAAAVPATTSSLEPVSSIPEPVKESLHQAHASPEAAANPEAVREKSALEKELTSKISPVTSAGEPAPSVSAATTSHAPLKQADANTLGALEGKSTGLDTAARDTTVFPTIASPATSSTLGASHASAVAASVLAAPVVASDSASKSTPISTTSTPSKSAPIASTSSSTPQVTTGIETTPTAATTTGSSAISSPSSKVTDPAAPVRDQGALKAATAASAGASATTPTANRHSQVSDVGSPGSTHTDASGKKKKRFSVFMDKLKDKLR